MGPSHNNTAKLLNEKDREISDLKLQLKAHAAQTSLIQNRLLATQGALDALKIAHDEELRAAQTTANKFRKRLNTYYDRVRTCEEQKDDLRDAVASFLQRVEEPQHVWPQPQIHISSLLEPLDPKLLVHRNQDTSKEVDDDLMKYAASMIETLVCERDLAREAYHSLYKDAQRQIAALEAQLAHRDYELEKCLLHRPTFPTETLTRIHLKPFVPLDPDTMMKVLKKTSARHKLLQQGNEKLEKQLEALKLSSTTPVASRKQSVGDIQAAEDSDLTIQTPLVSHATDSSRAPTNFIAQMESDIKDLGSVVQDFAIQRERLLKLVASQASDSDKPETDSTSPVPIEASIMSTNQPELAIAYEASLRREKSLLDENVKLVEMLRQAQTSPFSSVLEAEPTQVELLDAEEGEVSMELDTPLIPTTFISPEKPRPSSTPGTPKRQNKVFPLPPSPFVFVRAPSPPRSERASPLHGDQKLQEAHGPAPSAEIGTGDLERLADQLDSAGQQVAESERAVNDLADLIIDLQRTTI